jgi:Fe-S-cluster containining protein
MVLPLRRHGFLPRLNNPSKEGATAGLSSSGTPIVVNTIFQQAAMAAIMPRRPMRDYDSTSTTRAHVCGACRACCTHLVIPAGDVGPGMKPAGIPCPNITAAGCRIYGRRPKTCVNFTCAWLDDTDWPEGWRPDHSGLLCLRALIEPGTPAAAVYELRPDALQLPVAAEILNELKRTTTVVAIINVQQERKKLLGNWVASPPEPAVPAPHFVGRSRTKAKSDSAGVPRAGE